MPDQALIWLEAVQRSNAILLLDVFWSDMMIVYKYGKASGKPSCDAEDLLQMCISPLEVLERHERRHLEERKTKAREARIKANGWHTPDHWQFGVSQPDNLSAASRLDYSTKR